MGLGVESNKVGLRAQEAEDAKRLKPQPKTFHILFLFQEVVRRYASLFENGPEGAFRYVAGVIGNGGIFVGLSIVPNLMTAGGLAVKDKA